MRQWRHALIGVGAGHRIVATGVTAIVAAIWQGSPFSAVADLAALQRVDQEQIEAAIVDIVLS